MTSGLFTPGEWNVLVIVCDDMGVDTIGCYKRGANLAMTPQIDKLAARGIRIEKAWAHPTCTPTRAGIQTGLWPARDGMSMVIFSPGERLGYAAACADWQLTGQITLAHRLSTIGYQSGWFGKVHLVHPCPDVTGYDAVRTQLGYDYQAGWYFNAGPRLVGTNNTETANNYQYNAAVSGANGHPRILNGVINNGGNPAPGSLTNAGGSPTDYCSVYDTTQIVNDAIAWTQAKTAAKQPFLAYVAPHVPHVPITWPPYSLHDETQNYPGGYSLSGPILEGDAYQTVADAVFPTLIPVKPWYRASIKATDKELGRLIDAMPPNTIIILAGDNGSNSSTGSDGSTVEAPFDPARSKGSIYETGVWVPLIIAGGPIVNPGRSVNRLAHTTDIYNTVLQVAGYGIDRKTCDSFSMVPYMLSEEPPLVRCSMITERLEPVTDPNLYQSTVFTRRWLGIIQASGNAGPGYKLVSHMVDVPVGSQAEELYNLAVDPYETSNRLAGGYNAMTAVEKAAYDALSAKRFAYVSGLERLTP